jgi:hypothetical protein
MKVARKIFVGLAWLFVLAVAIQFLLAGLGVLGGESLEAHRQWGFLALHLIPILMLIAAIVGRMGRTVPRPDRGAVPACVSAAAFFRPRTRPALAAVAPRAQRPVHLRPWLPSCTARDKDNPAHGRRGLRRSRSGPSTYSSPAVSVPAARRLSRR